MGSAARTTLTLGRQQFAGTALLETDELLFHGETRLRIPLKSVKHVAVKDGALYVAAVIFAAAAGAGLTSTKVVRFSDVDTAEKLVIPRALR